MKTYRVLLFLFVALALLFASTQVLASPVDISSAKNMSLTTVTPGAKATEKADDKPTKQTNKQDKPKGKHEHFKGTIAAMDFATLKLTLRDGSSVIIGLTVDTRIKVPGPKNSAPASLASIQPGMTASVQASRDENDNLVALMVMVIPGKPSKIHRVGIVTEYTRGESITIRDKDGNTFTFTITGEIKLLPGERASELAVGSRVTIIAPRDLPQAESEC